MTPPRNSNQVKTVTNTVATIEMNATTAWIVTIVMTATTDRNVRSSLFQMIASIETDEKNAIVMNAEEEQTAMNVHRETDGSTETNVPTERSSPKETITQIEKIVWKGLEKNGPLAALRPSRKKMKKLATRKPA